MTLAEIKQAVDANKIVHWGNNNYIVSKNRFGDYYILCLSNKHSIGLTWADGITLNGLEDEFYLED